MNTVSIVIIVKNDLGIDDTLLALRRLKNKNLLDIVVVDASDPSVMSSIRLKYRAVNWIQFTPKNNAKPSIPAQRNVGIKSAKGGIVVFIDANCIPGPHWLDLLVDPITRGEENITAGSTRSSRPNTIVNLNPEHISQEYLPSSPTINLAFRKNILSKVGYFDESFYYGSDVDFTWRCIDYGYKIKFVSQAYVTHDWGDLNDEIKRSFKYGKARAALYRKHISRVKYIPRDDAIILAYGAWITFLPLTLWFWWYPFMLLLLVAKNYKHKPFKTVFINLLYVLGVIKGTLFGLYRMRNSNG